MIGKELFKNGNDLYIILRKIHIHNLSNKNGSVKAELFNAWKEYLGSDKVLKNQTHFLFCETIQEPEWEDIPNESLVNI
jgi:hypothetical protein